MLLNEKLSQFNLENHICMTTLCVYVYVQLRLTSLYNDTYEILLAAQHIIITVSYSSLSLHFMSLFSVEQIFQDNCFTISLPPGLSVLSPLD